MNKFVLLIDENDNVTRYVYQTLGFEEVLIGYYVAEKEMDVNSAKEHISRNWVDLSPVVWKDVRAPAGVSRYVIKI